MADGDKPSAQATLPLVEPVTAAPAAAPVQAQIEPAKAPDPAPAPTPEPAKAPEPAPAAPEPAKEPAKEAAPIDTPSLLESAGKEPAKAEDEPKKDAAVKDGDKKDDKAEAKPAEPAKEPAKEAAKPAEPAKEAAKAPEPPAFVIPFDPAKIVWPEQLAGTKADDPRVAELGAILGEMPANPTEAINKLMTLHANAMTDYAQQTQRDQIKTFNDTRAGWNKDVMGDAILGGAGHNTAMKAVARMRDLLVPKDMAAPRKNADGSPRLSQFEEFLRVTGAGDHPVFLHILHNAAKYYDEPALPPENPGLPPDLGKPNGKRSRVIYDHPRSNQNRN